MTIPDETGWTVLCNERAVLISDRSDKTGWDTKFHTEFYGFVGSVTFIGDPEKLPWNTTKVDVDLNNAAYRMALIDMRRFVEDWRKFAEQRKKGAKRGETLKSFPAKPSPTSSNPAASSSKKTPAKAVPLKTQSQPTTKADHNETREVLPQDIDEKHCQEKLLALVHEAKGLDMVEKPYAGMAVIRMLFETSAVAHITRHGFFAALKQAALAERRKKITVTPEMEKNFTPSLDELLAYLEQNASVWGSKENYLKHCVRKLSAKQKILNGVLHNPYQQINRTEAIQIRDDIGPLLRHLIEE